MKMNGRMVLTTLLAMTAAVAGACSSSEPKTATNERIIPYWLDRRVPAGFEQESPAANPPLARVEPAKTEPVATGNCASYRPGAGAGMNIAELAFPTGDKRTSAVLLHQVSPKQVRAGAPYDYEIHVTNITAGTLQNVVVNGESMQNMSIASSTPAAGRGAAGNAQWVIGDLGPCKTQIIKVRASAPSVGMASNCLSVSYNNTMCASIEVVQPALALTKTMSPANGLVCDPITVNFEVKNTGSGPAESVVIRDELPAGVTTIDGKNTVEFAVGTLAGGQSATRSVQVKATQKGRFENNAQATAAGGLTAQSNNTSVTLTQPALALEVKCPTRVFLGREVCYEVTVRNTGDAAANNAVVTANLPAGATFVRASDNGTAGAANVSWTIGSIPAGGNKTVTFCVRPGAAGAYAVNATATAACANQASANCSTNLEGIPAILVECVDDPDPITIGENTVYTITVTNQGSAPGTGIKLTAELPGQQDFVSGTGATAVNAAGKTITMAPVATLAPKASATWKVTVKANAAGDVRFRIRVTSDQFTNPIEETESTNIYQ